MTDQALAAPVRQGLAEDCDAESGILGGRGSHFQRRPGAGVERANNAIGHFGAGVVIDCRTDDDDVVDDSGWRGHVILPGNVACNIAKADLAAIAEVHARFAGSGIESDKTSIECGFKNTPAAGLPFCARRIEPGGNSAIDEAVTIISGELNHGIVNPELLARFRIDSENAIERGSEIELSIDEDRSSFQAAAFFAIAAIGNIADVKSPGDFESGDIFAIDLR